MTFSPSLDFHLYFCMSVPLSYLSVHLILEVSVRAAVASNLRLFILVFREKLYSSSLSSSRILPCVLASWNKRGDEGKVGYLSACSEGKTPRRLLQCNGVHLTSSVFTDSHVQCRIGELISAKAEEVGDVAHHCTARSCGMSNAWGTDSAPEELRS